MAPQPRLPRHARPQGRARPSNEFVLVSQPAIGLSMIYTKEAVQEMVAIGRVSAAGCAHALPAGRLSV